MSYAKIRVGCTLVEGAPVAEKRRAGHVAISALTKKGALAISGCPNIVK